MDKLSYQQARYVRNKSFSDLLAGQIASGGGVFSSAKKVIGLKTKAKITGIKEKFDPLNIVKFMTGGSNLAPALLGRLLGRSQKDIQNFAGGSRLSGIDKKTKLGPAPAEDTSGITEVLQKIYSFMKGSQDAENLRREKENNFKEENALEDERRHKQLLKALQNALVGRGDGKATKQSDGGSWWDNIKAALEISWKAISKFFSWVGKLVGRLIGKVKSIAKTLWNGIKSFGSMIWEKISSAISSILTPIVEKLRTWFPQTMEAASKGIGKLKDMGAKLFPKAAAKTEAKVAEEVAEKAASKIFWKGIPIIGLGAGLFFGAERAMAGDWIGAGLEVAGGLAGATGVGLPAELALGVATAAYEANFDAENEGAKETPTATPLPSTGAGAGRGTAVSAASDSRRVDIAPPSSAVTTSSNENRSLQIESKASDGSSTSVTNNTVTTPTTKPQNDTLNVNIPIVRNIEDTFSRLLFNSTRVV